MANQQLIKTPDSAANHCLLVTGERQRAVCHSDCGNAAHSSRLGFPRQHDEPLPSQLYIQRAQNSNWRKQLAGAWKKISISTLILPDSSRVEASSSWCLHVNMTLRSRLNKHKNPQEFSEGDVHEDSKL